tara:strand:+ start:341 stop:457 length:117 start_codon:yes stop_codon:yes gene_type:complete
MQALLAKKGWIKEAYCTEEPVILPMLVSEASGFCPHKV